MNSRGVGSSFHHYFFSLCLQVFIGYCISIINEQNAVINFVLVSTAPNLNGDKNENKIKKRQKRYQHFWPATVAAQQRHGGSQWRQSTPAANGQQRSRSGQLARTNLLCTLLSLINLYYNLRIRSITMYSLITTYIITSII